MIQSGGGFETRGDTTVLVFANAAQDVDAVIALLGTK